MQVFYELKFHLLRWTEKTNLDLSSSGICSRVWRTSSCPPSLPGNIGSELESTSRTCYGEVKKVLSMTLTRRWREPTSYVIVLGSWSMKTSWAMFIPSASLKSPTYWWYYDQNVLPKQEDAAPPPLSILQRWRRWGHRPGQPSWWPPSPPSTPATPPSSLFLVTCKELGKQVKLLTFSDKKSDK